MNNRIKIILSIICFFAFTTSAQAKKSENTQEQIPTYVEDKTEKAVSSLGNYQSLIQSLNDNAISNLSSLRDEIEFGDIRDAVKFAKALSQIKSHHYDAAADLLHSIGKNSLLAEYARYYEALSLANQKKFEAALAVLPRQSRPVSKIEMDQFFLRMKLYARTKDSTTLATEIAAIRKARPKDKWMAIKGEYYLGLSAWYAGDQSLARKHFTNVLVENPGTEYDKKIFRLFESKGISTKTILSESLWNLRAEKLIVTGYPHKALEIWKDYYTRDKDYIERVAYGTFKARQYKTAAVLYTELLKSGQGQSSEMQFLQKIAQSYSRYDNFDAAIETNKKIIAKFPGSAAAAEADFKLGFLYFDAGQYDKATTYLEKFIIKGSASQKDSARWFRFWSYYLTQKYEKALAELSAFSDKKAHDKNFANFKEYWRARLFEKLGKNSDARTLYSSLSAKDSLGYYGLLSAQRLAQKKLLDHTLISPSALSTVPSGGGQSTTQKPDFGKFKLDDALQRAILLEKMGLDNYAYDESSKSTSASAPIDYNAALAVQVAGNFTKGMVLLNRAANGGLPGANRLEGFRLGFPLAYEKYVKPFSQTFNIDDKFAYAIMRQESAFKPEVQSFAFALGLMQMIPSTGDSVARRLGFTHFHPTQLNEPSLNVYFGTSYLSRLLQRFNGNLVYATAAYNAGPRAVERWNANKMQLSPDEFIELIPYQETRNYVKKVLFNYWVYKKIY